MRGLIVDYFGVLDGTDEDRENWRTILTGAKANDVRLAVLSNEPEGSGADRVREDARAYGIEHVVLSGVIGVEKPDAEAFLEAARRLELEPRECVMVDDAIENVLGAVQTGMIGVFYQVFDRAAVEIRGLLGLDEVV
ncbi:HAD-IA family hydrolase [Dietzia aerolata]|uniref:HAD family hydrolase n=1 Tax=Dietzia aerolata TaxID=595984 RepID=A0ABV5JKX7_9ACTN|nr:HAD-IA family hydrolase [Dietzia aerolata]MBB0968412.1 HAD-IA family hydrolase [Dietzia aerolata]HIW68354.1 HAD-IA family hydrolase [Candidatus Dietzia merdigallinarum]